MEMDGLDGVGGRETLPQKLAFHGLFLTSLALVFCTFNPPLKGLPAAYYFALLVVLFLSGVGLILLSVWVSEHRTSHGGLVRKITN